MDKSHGAAIKLSKRIKSMFSARELSNGKSSKRQKLDENLEADRLSKLQKPANVAFLNFSRTQAF